MIFIFISLFFGLFLPLPVDAHQTPHVIEMTSSGFKPSTIEIDYGDEVVYKNSDQVAHWPASDIHPTHSIYSDFDSKRPIEPGEEWGFIFEKVGEFKFHDHLYPEFTGKIVVSGEEKDPGFIQKLKDRLERVRKEVRFSLLGFYYKLFPSKLPTNNSNFSITKVINEGDLNFFVRLLGPEEIMQKLIEETQGGAVFDCHQQAHEVGRVSFEEFGSSVFSKGDASCHSGYYHGAMEAFLSKEGTTNLGQKIDSICKAFPTSFGIFECLHGVGHGVMAFETYDLPKALELCRKLSSPFAQNSCYGGVFMENIVAAQGFGALESHNTKWVSKDPHFPCNAVSDNVNVQTQCYLMQTSRMLDINDYNFEEAGEWCLDAPEGLIDVCFQSLGRDAAGYTLRDPERIVEICKKQPDKHFDNCLVGGLNVIVDFWGGELEVQAVELCREVNASRKEVCYRVLEGRLRDVFGYKTESYFKVCNNFEEPYSSLCTP